MVWIEWIAAIAGAVSVYLSARENILSWPTAILNVSLYTFVFYESGLYSDMGLQVVYLILSVYGWYQWLHGGEQRTRLHVSYATPRAWAISNGLGLAFWLILAGYTSRLQGVSYPYLDSGLTTLSLIAQWMMTRKIIENWVLWRDARRWDRFRTLWHPEGAMWATWFQGTFEEFIAVSQQGYDKGVRIFHMLGGSTMDFAGERAIAETKVSIAQRAKVDGVDCDVTCWGRIYDFMDKRQGRWAIVLRRHIYEKDRMDPIDPSAMLKLDPALLARFPDGYRHLAYLQTRVGYTVRDDLPGLDGPALDALYAQGADWLAGKPLT